MPTEGRHPTRSEVVTRSGKVISMDLAGWIGIASTVIALLALLVAAWTFRQGAELDAFLAFTDRYEKIMSELPHEERLVDEWTHEVDPDYAIRLRYLNLCSEEFYLRKRFLLSGRVWKIWEAEIGRTLATSTYREAWPVLRRQFVSYPEFSRFVERCQRGESLSCVARLWRRVLLNRRAHRRSMSESHRGK